MSRRSRPVMPHPIAFRTTHTHVVHMYIHTHTRCVDTLLSHSLHPPTPLLSPLLCPYHATIRKHNGHSDRRVDCPQQLLCAIVSLTCVYCRLIPCPCSSGSGLQAPVQPRHAPTPRCGSTMRRHRRSFPASVHPRAARATRLGTHRLQRRLSFNAGENA